MTRTAMQRIGIVAWVALIVALLLPTVAMAAPEDTFVTFSGEGGDYITSDQTWYYDRSNSTISATGFGDNHHIQVAVVGDTWWYLDFVAPVGQALAPGSYPGATRYPFQSPTDPGLSLYGDGRACNTLTGSFEVLEASFGPFGRMERFNATFEQHCEGSLTSRAFGEVLIDNGPSPEPLAFEVSVDSRNIVSRIGRATIGGYVTCSKPTTVYLSGTLTQRVNRLQTSTGNWFVSGMPCSPEPTRWSTVVQPWGAPFNPGKAQVDTTAQGFDTDYGTYVYQNESVLVTLNRG